MGRLSLVSPTDAEDEDGGASKATKRFLAADERRCVHASRLCRRGCLRLLMKLVTEILHRPRVSVQGLSSESGLKIYTLAAPVPQVVLRIRASGSSEAPQQ